MEEDQFDDDPALRSAIRRACGDEAAPKSLRRRIEGMIAPVPPAPARTRRSWSWPAWMGESPYKTLAAAVVALLALGVMFWQAVDFFELGRRRPTIVHVEFPLTVAADMVKSHDQCAKLSDHHLVAGNDPAVAATQLKQTQGVTIASLSNAAGWQFQGAGECVIGASKGAHLLYSQGPSVVSIFTVKGPASCSGGNSDLYRGTLGGHPVSGFVHGGVVYAVVGSNATAQLSLAELDPLIAQVQSCVGSSACAMPPLPASTHSTAP